MNDSNSQFPTRLFGVLAIVAGVFIVLGGGCFVFLGMALGGDSAVGFLGLIIGIGMIFGGARMIKAAGRKDDKAAGQQDE